MTVDPCDTVVLLLLIVVVFVPDGSSFALFRKQDVDQSQTGTINRLLSSVVNLVEYYIARKVLCLM